MAFPRAVTLQAALRLCADALLSLRDRLLFRNLRLTSIEGFSRRKPVVVAQTHNHHGAGRGPAGPLSRRRPYAALRFRGRPPLRPFLRAARAFAWLRDAPPRLPSSLIHRRFPKTPSIRLGT